MHPADMAKAITSININIKKLFIIMCRSRQLLYLNRARIMASRMDERPKA